MHSNTFKMKKIFVLPLVAFASQAIYSQTELPTPSWYTHNSTITTGVPFLLISADARSAGMGDMGVATSTDAFSQQNNPAKYAFAEQSQGFSVSYTPYMSKIATDMSLAQITYYNKINERSAIGASLRYFGLGEIQFSDDTGRNTTIQKPNEFAVDLSYSLKLSDRFSGAVAARYISSNLQLTDEREGSANSIAVDIAGYYESDRISLDGFDGVLRAGFNLQNLGPKISYSDVGQENFLPSNLRFGAGFDFILDEYNKITPYVEFTKLLVPSRPEPTWSSSLDTDGDGTISPQEGAVAIAQNNAAYRSGGWVSGLFKSFGDAPGGFSEELKEFTWALGAEYWYQNSFAFRMGYFNESEMKGARKYATLGAGFKYNTIKVDVSYLFAMSKVQNPLDNTLRFSLTFNFGNKF